MIRITDILDKTQSYLTPAEQELIEKAYIFSASVHQGQVRLSGEPYLTHPMEVAGILCDMKLDAATIVTGLLHDTVEDTLTTLSEIRDAFGKDVEFLVDGLTKISRIMFESKVEQQAENFRKMILAMSADIRILLIRLADRLHNMRTLRFQTIEKQKYIAKETLDLYAPLANRLGINWMKVDLEDMAFQYLNSEAYNDLLKRVAKKKEEREQYTKEVKTILQKEIDRFGLKGTVEGRAKHFYGIYKKMTEQNIDFDEVYDLIAFRIILDSDREIECYEALSVVHALWKPVPGRFKDYIAMPKANNYRALHTTVIGPYGERLEVQIRSKLMHEWAEDGIAAHWRYKEGRPYKSDDAEHVKKLRELLEVQQESKNPREYISNLKMALFPDEVYVFTPKGEVKAFPKGATPIDFAYSIHTDVGDQCIGAKVNRVIVPLKYQLQNGDTVEIITQTGHVPSKDWLKYVVTSRAKSKIRHWVKTEERKRSIALGKDLLEKELKRHNLKLSQLAKSEEIKKIFTDYSIGSVDDLMAIIGYGKVSARRIANYFLPDETSRLPEAHVETDKKKSQASTSVGISLTGIEDVLVKFAKCCHPIPGDEISGFISRGRGVIIHTATCSTIEGMDTERIVDVHWNIKQKQTFPVNLKIICKDKKGLLAEISSTISSLDVNISHAEVDTRPEMQAICHFLIDVNDLQHLNQLIHALKKLKNVISVDRVRRA